ncbi:MAG: hypothetical protein ACR2GT_06165 [Gaiellaceae bacterium]
MRRIAIVAGGWAAVVSGAPSTSHAVATGRDPLEAAKAAGAILLPRSTRTLPLILAAVPVHLGASLGWALVLDRLGVRSMARGAAAGLAIAALDVGIVGPRFPRVRALPRAPQILDHLVYGAIVGAVLSRARERDSVP